MKRSLVLFSGGIDSTVAAKEELLQGNNPVLFTASSFAGEVEFDSAKKIAKELGCEQVTVNLSPIQDLFRGGNLEFSLGADLGGCPNDGFIAAPLSSNVLLMVALMYAAANGFKRVVWGLNADDVALVSKEDIDRHLELNMALVKLRTGEDIELVLPLLGLSKRQVLERGLAHGLPMHETRSCANKDAFDICGKCSQCRARATAFAMCGDGDGQSQGAEVTTPEDEPQEVTHERDN